MKRIYLLICLLLGIFCTSAYAASPPETPFVRLNTVLHSAKIMDIAANSGGSLLATASYDKTVKLWDADSGKLLKTFRPPIGAGLEGTLFAVALSPDGSTVAAAGWTGFSWDKAFCVYLFNVNTGEITKRLIGLPQSIQRLAFSRDGKRLALGLNASGGVRVVNLADSSSILDDLSFEGNCFGLEFDQRGNLVASSDAGNIRVYRADGSTAYTVKTENGKQILDTRFSPDGKQLAVVYDDYYGVEVRAALDGTLDFVLQQPKGRFFSVAWSADGRHLLAAGGNKAQDSRKLLVKWSVETRSLDNLVVLPSKNGITRLLALKDSELAFVSRMTGFGVISHESNSSAGFAKKGKGKRHQQGATEAEPQFFHQLSTADFQKNHDLFRISPDGLSVLFSYERYGQSPARFDLKTRKIVVNNPPDTDLLLHRFTADGINVQNWEDSEQPRLNKRILDGFGSRDLSRSLAIRHDEKGFVLGSNHYLRHFARNGRLLWKQRIPQVAWDISLSADDKTLVAALDDSTVRWYRMTDGRELYALYLHPDKKRWLLWSPDGFFDHGTGSANLIGFQVNRGIDQSSVMVGAERMYDLLYRPDLIDKIIVGEDVSAYLQRLTVRPQVAVEKNVTVATDLKQLSVEKARKEEAEKQRVEYERTVRLKAEADRRLHEEQLAAARQAKEQAEKEQVRLAQDRTAREQAEKERVRLDQEHEDQLRQHEADRKRPSTADQLLQEKPNDEPLVVYTALESMVKPATLPPKVRFVTVSGISNRPDVSIQADLCDGGGGVGAITLFINKMPVVFEQHSRGLVARTKGRSPGCERFERIITLAPGQNTISLMAFNAGNSIESERDQITLQYAVPELEKPRLYLLTIAVNRYRDGDLRLKYSIDDAEGVIKLVAEKSRSLFSGVETYRLHDEQVTKAELEKVVAKIGGKATRGDVFVLFMAGHGLTDEMDGMYYFLPVDFRYTGLESVAKQGISMLDFKRMLSSIQAMKSLFLIDTCNSGSFSEGMASRGVTEKVALNKLARAVGRATIAASSKNQVALEGFQGHGVFSYTVMEGLRGNASNRKGEITINALASYIEETLPERTYKKWGYEQIPQKSLIGSDFPIGLK
jgi:WD40 repeat protein